jgi:hypothetical protein
MPQQKYRSKFARAGTVLDLYSDGYFLKSRLVPGVLTKVLHAPPQSLQECAKEVFKIRPRSLDFTSVPIHCSLSILYNVFKFLSFTSCTSSHFTSIETSIHAVILKI